MLVDRSTTVLTVGSDDVLLESHEMNSYLEHLPPEAVQLVRAALDSLQHDAKHAYQRMQSARQHLHQTGMDEHAAAVCAGLGHVASICEQLEGLQIVLGTVESEPVCEGACT